ncbi:MAG: hemolysin III family protein [Actinomycetota bacterium]|nr:hemolysin III family protein [Actinomycetota bacterium]
MSIAADPVRQRTAVEIKPRMRGWLHTYAAVVSLVAGVILVAVATATHGSRAGIATTIYAITVTLLFGTSAVYHRRGWGPTGHGLMKRLDHSMIFVFIAGTYTPFAVLTLPKTSSAVVLAVVWAGALFGVILKNAWPNAPRFISVPLYIALGWVAVFMLPQLLHSFGVAALVLIATGGILYTLGALAYGFKRPNPYPNTFGFHEVFHLCTLVAAACHYIAVWFAVFS